ncbi:MAG: hypothetical protein NTU47_09005 [Ignavibacteriales bacterium]|nr:hypothetical protein [Ignavibacteriales bacterium]
MVTLPGTVQSRADGNGGQLSGGALGEAKMVRLASKLVRLAPKPGALVYLDAAPLSVQVADTQPILFSAFDACTHLQIARIYLTSSFACAADFLDFVQRRIPFGISRIRTTTVAPFWVDPLLSPVQRFTNHLEAQGILHILIADRSEDDLFSVFDHLTFVHQAGSSHRLPAIPELVGEVITFLYFHNNNRAMASLNGKTPLEKLKTFPGLETILSFDPFAPETARLEYPAQPANHSRTAARRISA